MLKNSCLARAKGRWREKKTAAAAKRGNNNKNQQEEKKKTREKNCMCHSLKLRKTNCEKLNRIFQNRSNIDDDDVVSRHHSGTQMSTLISECLQFSVSFGMKCMGLCVMVGTKNGKRATTITNETAPGCWMDLKVCPVSNCFYIS